MLLEIAIEDAYGAGFEYVDKYVIESRNNLESYISHQKHQTIPGAYTDDTQMSVAIAELLIERKEWTALNIASQFVKVFKRDQRKGYASHFYDFLLNVQNGKEFMARINPTSSKSGAAMRASPIGILPEIDKVIEYATLQAQVTHNTSGGVHAAIAAALMSHYFIHQHGQKKDLRKFIQKYVPGDWGVWSGEVGSSGFMSVRAALTAVLESDSLSSILRKSVSFGGDVDTVAAIAMGAASCSSETEQDLPPNLVNNLENGPYGKGYLVALDKKLHDLS